MPFALFAALTALAYGVLYVLLANILRPGVIVALNVFMLAVVGLLLLARDRSKKGRADV